MKKIVITDEMIKIAEKGRTDVYNIGDGLHMILIKGRNSKQERKKQ